MIKNTAVCLTNTGGRKCRKDLSALGEIRRDNRKVHNVKRTRLIKKYNTEKKENLDQVTEELKQKGSAKTQRLSSYRKRQNHC